MLNIFKFQTTVSHFAGAGNTGASRQCATSEWGKCSFLAFANDMPMILPQSMPQLTNLAVNSKGAYAQICLKVFCDIISDIVVVWSR